jgi:hypothetical protein
VSERLDQAMREVLLQLAVCSHVAAANPQGASRSSDEALGGRRPPGDHGAGHYADRYDACASDHGRARVLQEARAELEHLRKRRAPVAVGETADQLAARIVNDGAGWSLDDIAHHFRCTKTFAVRARRAAGLDTEFGQPPAPVADVTERRARVRHMRHVEGRSVVQIALVLGVHRNTVHRDLETAA